MTGVGSFKRLTVLVLDEHKHMRSLLRTVFRGFGIRKVIECPTMQDAIGSLNTTPVDILFSDYRMRLGDGGEFTRTVRGFDQNPHRFAPIIMCTATTTQAAVRDMVDSGADEILQKPVSAAHIWRKIRAVIEDRRPFIRAPGFFGPDRRRVPQKFDGEERRSNTKPVQVEAPGYEQMREMNRTFFTQSVEF